MKSVITGRPRAQVTFASNSVFFTIPSVTLYTAALLNVFIFSFFKVSLVGSHHKAVSKRKPWHGREFPLLSPTKLNLRVPRAHSQMGLSVLGLWGRDGPE